MVYGIYCIFAKRALVHVTPAAISDITHVLHLSVNIKENRNDKIQQTCTMLVAILKETGKKQC